MGRKHQQGVSMIEVLVTIGVMSFGFLSLASFQLGTLNHLSGSNQHYLATTFASSMGESIRANSENVNEYQNVQTDSFSKDCSSVTCSIAEYDIWLWQQAIEEHGMPNAVGSIDINANSALITITWDEKASLEKSRQTGDQLTETSFSLQVPL